MSLTQPHFSPARRAGDFVFVSGQMPFDEHKRVVPGDIAAQTAQCLRNVQQALLGVGADLQDIVKVMVWLTDAGDFPAFNQAYATFFPGIPPARATVCSALMVSGARIEIEATAWRPV